MTDLEWQQKKRVQDYEDMFVKILGRRARIGDADDPARLAGSKEEWWVIFSLIGRAAATCSICPPWSHLLCRRAASNRGHSRVLMSDRRPAKPIPTMPCL